MFKQIWRLLMWGTEDRPSVPKETFGGVALDSSLGLAILSDPKRQRLCQSIRELMMGIDLKVRGDYVDRLLLRFALFVVDLQASAEHHDARPYGLLDHSLEVAYRVALIVSRPSFRVSEDPAANYREHPRWSYAATVCALLHDVGKVLDLDVSTPDGKDRWVPTSEPLAAFCARNGLRETGPRYWNYRAGRGIRFHAWHGPLVFPLVLTPTMTSHLGHRLTLLTDAMIAGTLERAPEAPNDVAARAAKIIHEADVEASKESRQVQVVSAPAPAKTPAVVAAEPPPSVPPPPALQSPPVPPERPPLDPGKVIADFTAALRTAVQEGWIPLNEKGGLYVGRKHVYLHYPEGMEKVLDLMIARGSDLEERFEEDLKRHPDQHVDLMTPEGRVLLALIAEGRMPYSNEEWSWIQQGEVVHPGDDPAKPWQGQVVLMNMPFADLPRFQGKLNLDQIGDPESDFATNPLKPQAKEAPPIPVSRRSREEAYDLRVRSELEPARLLATLLEGISTGVFHRPGAWSPVYIRPDFIWVVVPETFKILLPRMGIRFTEELENEVLRSVQEMPTVAKGEDGRVVLRIRVHPDSRQSVWAFALATSKALSAEQVAALGLWEFPVRVVEEPTPGEYAA